MERTRRSSLALLLLAVLPALLAGFYRAQPAKVQGPLAYRLGAVDGRFALSRAEAAVAVRAATDLWSKAAGRELFREAGAGGIEVRFVYDYRQEAADKLKGISGNISCTRGSYDALKARFEREREVFRQKEAELQADVREYNRMVAALNADIAAANRGGMTEEAHRRLTASQEELDGWQAELDSRSREQQDEADNLNRLVVVINGIAASLNLEVIRYNRTGSVLASEFSEGLYERKNGRESITVYHFTSRERLVRLLAHEFGHALGLGHGSDPGSLMYRLNRSDSLSLTREDLAALKAALRKRGL